MDRVESESFGLFCPCSCDELIRRQPLQRLQSASEIVCVDEVREMRFELLVTVVMEAFYGRFLDRAVHSLDLSVGPWMFDLGQPVLDAVFSATHVEPVRQIGRPSGRRRIAAGG